MSQQLLLKRVVEALDRAGIDYMITGSVASSLQGEPRSTHDIDVVIAIEDRDVPALDIEGGDKVDLWLLTADPFDRSHFGRKYAEEVFGIPLKVSRPEDTILQKLRWSKASGGSERSYLDALRVYEVQARQLDLAYIEEWAARLDVPDLWNRILREAEEL